MSTRLFVKNDLITGATLFLEKETHHYVAHVLRAKIGDSFCIFNGREGAFDAIISALSKKEGTLIIGQQTQAQSTHPTIEQQPTLFFAPIKRERQFFLVEKATELGVGTLCPIKTEYTQHRATILDRLEKQAIEASEQSERLTVPDILPEISFEKCLKNWNEGVLFVGIERHDAPPLQSVLHPAPKFLIGPEGGFSPREVEMCLNHPHIQPFSLGPLVLRAETAAIASLALYQGRKMK